jgi:hypothetical protein
MTDIHRNIGAGEVLTEQKGAIKTLSGRTVYPNEYYPVFVNVIYAMLQVAEMQEKRIRGLEKKLGLRESV